MNPVATARRPPLRKAGPGNGLAAALLSWKTVVGVLIGAALLYFTFRGVDMGEVLREMAQARPLPLLAATVAATFVFWVRAWRWRAILDPVQRGTTFHSRFAAVCIGFMGNNLLPARIGEFARAYALSRREPVPVVASLSSLVIERLFDAICLVLFLFGAMALPGFPSWPDNATTDFPAIARGLGFTVAGIFALLFFLVLRPRTAVRAFEVVANRVLPRAIRRPIVDALEAFLAGAAVLRDPRLLLASAAWSVGVWLVNGLGFWFAFQAFDLDLSFAAALFFQSCIAIGVSVPGPPGFFGTYEFAAKVVLVDLWAMEANKALGFALGFHIAGFIPVTLMGLWYAWSLGLSLRGIAGTEKAVEEAVEAGVGPAGE